MLECMRLSLIGLSGGCDIHGIKKSKRRRSLRLPVELIALTRLSRLVKVEHIIQLKNDGVRRSASFTIMQP
jgi:hypothetical protein